MPDHSYGQAYADWQAELRASASASASRRAVRVQREGRVPRGRTRPAQLWWRVVRPWSAAGR